MEKKVIFNSCVLTKKHILKCQGLIIHMLMCHFAHGRKEPLVFSSVCFSLPFAGEHISVLVDVQGQPSDCPSSAHSVLYSNLPVLSPRHLT